MALPQPDRTFPRSATTPQDFHPAKFLDNPIVARAYSSHDWKASLSAMTIYVDDAYKSDPHVKRVASDRRAAMIGTDLEELHRFARKLGLTEMSYDGGYYHLPPAERLKASLLGAVEVPVRTLAAMMHLSILGEDIEPAETASARRHAISKI